MIRSRETDIRKLSREVALEYLNDGNEAALLQIHREDVPEAYVEDVSATIALAKYGGAQGLKGHCWAVKYRGQYVGILLLGEALEDSRDPEALRGKVFFRLLGFVIDARYRGLGIGSAALEMAIHALYAEYGPAPLLLECHRGNTSAQRFYKKHGFINIGQQNGKGTDFFFLRSPHAAGGAHETNPN